MKWTLVTSLAVAASAIGGVVAGRFPLGLLVQTLFAKRLTHVAPMAPADQAVARSDDIYIRSQEHTDCGGGKTCKRSEEHTDGGHGGVDTKRSDTQINSGSGGHDSRRSEAKVNSGGGADTP